MAKKPEYADQPVAPASKIANKPIIQNPSLGNDVPNIVPPSPTAVGKPPIGGAHKASKVGHLRMSGHPKAHRIGGK